MIDHIQGKKPILGVTLPINEILTLDGRYGAPRVRIFRKLPGSAPKVSAVKHAIAQFLETGESGRHSENATLLRYIVAYCEANNVGYVLTRVVVDKRAVGYHIKRLADVPLLTECQGCKYNEAGHFGNCDAIEARKKTL